MAEYFSTLTTNEARPELIIICAGGHAKVVLDIFEKQGSHIIRGFVDDGKTGFWGGYPILGRVSDLPALVSENTELFIAIGDNNTRYEIWDKYPEYNYAVAIHPSAQIGDNVDIGMGTCVMAGVVINSGTRIDPFGIVNTGARLDHDNYMGEFSSVAPGVVCGGHVAIGGWSAVCIGAIVLHGIEIGQQSVIGAGSVVTRDIPPCVVAYGTPCKVIRSRKTNDPYL